MMARNLRFNDALAAVRFILSARRNGFRLDHDISVAELLDRHRQPENVRRFLWESICIAALNTPPGRASARVFLNVLRDSLNGTASDCDLLFSRVDLSAVSRAGATLHSRQGRHGAYLRRSPPLSGEMPVSWWTPQRA